MILDDLFNQAAQFFQAGKTSIRVECALTTNQTGGLDSAQNKNNAASPAELTYQPEKREVLSRPPRELIIPASFSGAAMTITSKVEQFAGSNYSVQVPGAAFVPAVDDKTNIIYGAAGSVFFTISLCGFKVDAVPQ